MSHESAIQKDRYRVFPGEPGRDVITPLKNGKPVTENLFVPQAPSPSLLPAVVEGQSNAKPTILSKYDKTAHLRFTLVSTLAQEWAKESGSKVKTIDRLLDLYNGGLLLPGILKELGPISRRTLYRFLETLTDKGIDGLAPQYGRSGRKPFTEITSAEKQFLVNHLLHPNRPKTSDAIRECKRYLGEHSGSSPATLRRYVNDFKKSNHDVWVLAREGEKAWNDKIAPYQNRDPMSLDVGQILVADGHKLNLNVLDPVTGKKKRATIVLFWDWKSTYPLGLSIAFSENTQCIWEALRNAILELGKTPSEVYIDNGKAFLAKIFTQKIVIEETEIPGILARLHIGLRRALRYHGQSKPIERFFGILNDRLERRLPSYVGNSIKDKPAYLLRNEPRARALHNDWTPAISDLLQIFFQWREEYIDEPLPKRRNLTARQIFEEGKGPGIDPKELCFLMMAAEVKTVRRNRLTFAGVDWDGDCLYGYRGKVTVRYSLSDLSKIYVFDPKDQFIGILAQASVADAVNDWQAAKRIITARRAFKRQTKKLTDLIREKSLLIEGRSPQGLLEYIRAEEAKKIEKKIISPFIDDPDPQLDILNEPKTDMAADHGSPLSCPWFKEDFETFEWYCTNDPRKFNIADLAWIDCYNESELYKECYMDESGRRLGYLLSKRPVLPENLEDKPLTHHKVTQDPAVEAQWVSIRETIFVDQTSRLTLPSQDKNLVSRDGWVRYGFYRGIEKRFPGTLAETDWTKVEEYEAENDWKLFYRGCSRLRTPLIAD